MKTLGWVVGAEDGTGTSATVGTIVAPVQPVEESGIELGEVFWPCTRLLGTSVCLLVLCGCRPALLLQFAALWLGRVQSNGIR